MWSLWRHRYVSQMSVIFEKINERVTVIQKQRALDLQPKGTETLRKRRALPLSGHHHYHTVTLFASTRSTARLSVFYGRSPCKSSRTRASGHAGTSNPASIDNHNDLLETAVRAMTNDLRRYPWKCTNDNHGALVLKWWSNTKRFPFLSTWGGSYPQI